MCSVGRVFERLTEAFGRRRLLIVTGALLLLALAVKVIDKANWALPLIGTIKIAGIGRTTVGPLLLLHFLVSVVFIMQIVPRGQSIARSAVLGLVARVGQYSLECFCASTVFVYVAAAWMTRTDNTGSFAIFIVGMLILALVGAWAVLMNRIRTQPWRRAAAASPANAPEVAAHKAPIAETRSLAATGLPRESA